jgi:hypothetical protein
MNADSYKCVEQYCSESPSTHNSKFKTQKIKTEQTHNSKLTTQKSKLLSRSLVFAVGLTLADAAFLGDAFE